MIVLDHSDYTDKKKNFILDPKRASNKNEPLNAQEHTLFLTNNRPVILGCTGLKTRYGI